MNPADPLDNTPYRRYTWAQSSAQGRWDSAKADALAAYDLATKQADAEYEAAHQSAMAVLSDELNAEDVGGTT